MIVDAREHRPRAPLDCDLCIVGAGAAGLAVALELAKSRLSICVLESGGLRHDKSTQSMLRGETGNSYYPPLHTLRVAGLGGSMRVWAGWCRPLDEVDLEARDAVPHSGWPFGLDEMRPYYSQAHDLLEIGPFDYHAPTWESQSRTQRLELGGDDVTSVLFRRSPSNVGRRHLDTLKRLDNVTVWLHATVMRLRYSPDGKAVTAMEVATLNHKSIEVRPRTVVVAAGGIETVRLLLLSSEGPQGSANSKGLVGRFFTDHGYDETMSYVPADPRRPLSFYYANAVTDEFGRRVARGAFAPSAATLRREGLLNCAIYFRPAYEVDPIFDDPRVRAVLELWDMLRSRAVPDRRLARALQGLSAPHALLSALWRRFCAHSSTHGKVRLISLFECAPNPDNRVVLGAARDALGRRLARVVWRMSERDLHSVARAYELLDAGLRSAGLGRLQARNQASHDARTPRVTIAKHHLGTARMHRDPAKGVTDENGKVHGVDNLFITGGSTFATGGYANPALTIVALALRLSAHLKREIRPPH